MTKWQHQYPSVWVTRTYDGDRLKAVSYIGEGNNLLYQLKNNIKFNDLGRLKMERVIRDIKTGLVLAVIKAESVFGHDTVYIYCPGGGIPSCEITLYNLPEAIPPMKWYALGLETWEKVGSQWVIKDPSGVIEVEGVDYIKTYYSYTIIQCPLCNLPKITLSDRTIGEDVLELTNPLIDPESIRRAFRYKSEMDNGTLIYTYDGIMVPHYMGDATSDPIIPPEPKTHTIYSFDGLNTTHKGYDAQAEIIKFDTDSGGTYFLWKAYTDFDTYFTRGGLGYMLMKAFVYNGGAILCESDPSIIKVDCCEKIIDYRPVEIWWEGIAGSCTGATWFMNYDSTDICKMPVSLPSSDLFFYTSIYPFQPFYSIPEVKGSCLPIEWELSGTINFRGSDKNDSTIYTIWDDRSTIGQADCHDEANITLRDRCGTEYNVRGVPCCENPSPLVINYTSLSMPCGGYQSFSSSGGCGPVTWSATPGSIGQDGVYHAADTNPGCHVEITVTDCCGVTATIHLAINCAPNNYIAFVYAEGGMGSCYWNTMWGMWAMDGCWAHKEYYRCDNTPWGLSECDFPPQMVLIGSLSACEAWTPCLGLCWWDPCGTTDRRTEAQIQDGCCPIDFETGLPM